MQISLCVRMRKDFRDYLEESGIPARDITSGTSRQRTRTVNWLRVQLHGGGLSAYFEMAGRDWVLTSIDLNPGKLSYGHNGQVCTDEDLVRALTLVLEILKPLLRNPEDALRLVPGLSPGSPSYWRSLEFFLHLPDPDGKGLARFWNARHPGIRKAALRCPDESVRLGVRSGGLLINVYNKTKEMARLLKDDARNQPGVLRVEVTLGGGKLPLYFEAAGASIAIINEKPRVVGFTPAVVRSVHRKIMGELQGVCAPPDKAAAASGGSVGAFVGAVAILTGQPLDDLIDLYVSVGGKGSATRSRVRKDALATISAHQEVSVDQLFSDAAYDSGPSIFVPHVERMYSEVREQTVPHSLIQKVYLAGERVVSPFAQVAAPSLPLPRAALVPAGVTQPA